MPAEPRWKRALVTGASSGIGRAFATTLAGAGTDLVVVARRGDRLDALAAEIGAAHPDVDVEVMVADLSDREALAVVEARAADRERPVDLLINNAGFGTHGRFHTLPVDRETEELDLMVVAPMRLTHAALSGMVERGHGAVVNVSSLVGLKPISLWATYSAAKAFLASFTLAVEREVREHGVQVMLLMPGFTRTEFGYPEGFSRQVVPGPLWMKPEKVARTALRDLARGKRESVSSPLYRVFGAVTRITPKPVAHAVVKVATRAMWRK